MALFGMICMILIGVGIAIFFSTWIIYGILKASRFIRKEVEEYLARVLDE